MYETELTADICILHRFAWSDTQLHLERHTLHCTICIPMGCLDRRKGMGLALGGVIGIGSDKSFLTLITSPFILWSLGK